MIKRTLYFGSPAWLSLRLGQIVVKVPESVRTGEPNLAQEVRTIPVEDVGIVILDNSQITITHGLMAALLENGCAVITCDASQLPTGLLLPLSGNTLQNERFRYQIGASVPLKKQLWQQTIQCKIGNQAKVLEYTTGQSHGNMKAWVTMVKSGDVGNIEARAAAYYWKTVFPDNPRFQRDRDGAEPNNLLNYGYAILRAVIAKSLVASGLLPTLGIHHHNRYNAYCLADDIMEPYRPFVDRLVYDICTQEENLALSKEMKARLLAIPTSDVQINGKRSPLMVAASTTTASLVKCFSGEARKISYPEFIQE